MDTTLSPSEVAQRLGVPTSRVMSWCRRGRIEAERDARGRWRLSHTAVARWTALHGAVPQPFPAGHTRTELLVTAALVRAPRGFPSARSVASRVGTSPTTASNTLRQLEDAGLARRVREPRLWRGRAVEREIWYANFRSDELERLLPYIHRLTLPHVATPTSGPLPEHLWHLVWNAEPRDIDVARDAAYLAHRSMTLADPEGIGWAVATLPADAFDRALRMRGVAEDNVAWARAARGAAHAAP
jgi:excisionase family DNA binding protein